MHRVFGLDLSGWATRYLVASGLTLTLTVHLKFFLVYCGYYHFSWERFQWFYETLVYRVTHLL